MNVELMSVWQAAPAERTALFRKAFGAAARAAQQALRERLPSLYFDLPDRYHDLQRALPMLVYQSSRPSPRRHAREYAYDVLNAAMMRGFFWSVERDLPNRLRRLEVHLFCEGSIDLARAYALPRFRHILDRVRARKRLLDRLLAAECKLVNELLKFSSAAREARCPQTQTRRLLGSWRIVLRRVYPGVDASGFASDLFEIASGAFAQALEAASCGGAAPEPPRCEAIAA